MSKRNLALLALTCTAVIWGAAVPIIRLTLQYVPTFTFLFWRFVVASLFILPFFFRNTHNHIVKKEDVSRLILLGLLATIHFTFVFWGFAKTSSLEGALISSISPVFTVIAGVIFLHDKITTLEKIGLAIILFGTTFTFIPSLSNLQQGATNTLIGNLLIISAGLVGTAFVILSKELLDKYNPLTVTAMIMFVCLIIFFPLALWEQSTITTGHQIVNVGLAAPGILFMGLFSSVLAYGLYEYGLKSTEASEASIFSYLSPLFTIPIAFYLLAEIPNRYFILGGLIIALGVLIHNQGSSNQRKTLRHSKILK